MRRQGAEPSPLSEQPAPRPFPPYGDRAARVARADRLRPHVAAWVKERGADAVAAAADLKAASVRRFVNQGVTPQPGAMDGFEEMMQLEEWSQLSGGSSSGAEGTGP